jgi:hypothetical protein
MRDAFERTGKVLLRISGFGFWLGLLSLAVCQELAVASDRGTGEQ